MRVFRKYLAFAAVASGLQLVARAEVLPEEMETDQMGDVEILPVDDQAAQALSMDSVDAATATYAWPAKRVLQGTKKLACIGVKYQNVDKVTTQAGCQYAADNIAAYYLRNSRGLLKIQGTGYEPFAVAMNGNATSYNKAVDMIKKAYPGFDYYVIPGIYTYPHAGAKVAHVQSAQLMTAYHEVGHLLGLGHAGAYIKGQDGSYTLKAYGDTDSIMGRIISRYITAPQYYYLGWLPSSEVVMFDPNAASYDLKKIGDFNVKGTATVILPTALMPVDQTRVAFVSVTNCDTYKSCVSLHLSSGGGSQKVAEFPSEFYDATFTGAHIKVLQRLTNGRLRIAIDFNGNQK